MMQASVTQITKPGESRTLTKASAQWRDRPPDERYSSMSALKAAAWAYRNSCVEEVVNLNALTVGYEGSTDELLVGGHTLNHFGFGQLCSVLGQKASPTPAAFLRTMPTDIVTQVLKHQLSRVSPEDSSKLLVSNGRTTSVTGPNYGRIWNCELAEWICELQDAMPWWTFPVAFRQAGGETKEGAWGESKELPVAFMSSSEMFVFLCDYEHGIEIPGSPNPLSRGFWIENSEVGNGSLIITMFLFDFVCSNVLVWGARNVVEVKIRHTSGARNKILVDDSEARKSIEAFANRETSHDVQRIVNAQNLLIADTEVEVIDAIYGRRMPGLTKGVIEEAVTVARKTPRYGNPCSVWAFINGLTEVSQSKPIASDRIAIDRSAGKLIDLYVPFQG